MGKNHYEIAILELNVSLINSGLYDPKLGPLDQRSGRPCVTCNLSYKACPGVYISLITVVVSGILKKKDFLGHSGHIELRYPVYQPLQVLK